jgi:hypothetical protein
VNATAIDWTSDRVLEAAARGAPLEAAGLTLLLRRYAATGREDLGDALGGALARALAAHGSDEDATAAAALGRPAWLAVFAEASCLSDDVRLRDAVVALAAALRREWPGRAGVGAAMRSVEACLGALPLLPAAESDGLLQAAVDELERIVAACYRPGYGVTEGSGDAAPAALGDHMDAASALLTAFEATGRLPYSMLAEELVQHARRAWWHERRGGFQDTAGRDSLAHLVANCSAARVLGRLAVLLEDERYRTGAVFAGGADYRADAERTLASLASSYRDHGADAAPYAVALDEFLRRPLSPAL